jgi:hypothetical protein
VACAALLLGAAGFLGACGQLIGTRDRSLDPHLGCADGECVCTAGFGDCDGDTTNGCETVLSVRENCGGCGNVCQNGACTAGACACTVGFADCNAKPQDGCEASLLGDPHHCGTCGTDCSGGACKAGRCQPVTLATFSEPESLALGKGFAYVGDCAPAAILAVPLTGGPPAPVVDAVMLPSCAATMALVAGTLYWRAEGPEILGIYTSPIDHVTAPLLLATPLDSSFLLAAGPTHVYWNDFDANGQVNELRRIPFGGGTIEQFPTNGQLTAIAVDATRAYWWDSSDGLHAIPHAGTQATLLSPGSLNDSASSLAVDEKYIYAGVDVGLVKIPLGGGAAVKIANTQSVYWMTIDATHVYWTDYAGSVNKVPIAGGPSVALATGESFLAVSNGIFVDDQWVYYLSGNALKKIAK